MSKPRGQKAPRRFLIVAVINSRPPACVCARLVGYVPQRGTMKRADGARSKDLCSGFGPCARLLHFLLVLAAIAVVAPLAALAAPCSDPDGVEGELIYNTTHKVAQFCNGTHWISMAAGASGGGPDSDTLGALSCANDEIPNWSGASWACAADDGGADTLASLSCSAGEVPEWDGSAWVCSADGGGSGSTSSYMLKGLPSNMTSPSAGTAVTFSAVVNAGGSGITQSGNRITLAPGSSYMLRSSLRAYDGGTGFALDYQIYDVTNATYVGIAGSANSGTSDTQAVAFASPSASTTYEVRIAGGGAATVYGGYSYFSAVQIGGGSGSDTLAGLSCAANEIPKWNGSAWACAPDGNDGGASMTGAVMAFNASTCPTGWTEYTPARGRFLRGIDNGAGNDPDGTRTPGDIQNDQLQDHMHYLPGRTAQMASGTERTRPGQTGGTQETNSFQTVGIKPGTANYGDETRPKNVAVIFCQYNGTGGLGGGGSGSTAAFYVHKNGTNQTVPTGTATKLTWSAETFDTSNGFGSDKFQPTVAGKYMVSLNMTCLGSTNYCLGQIFKNGSPYAVAQAQHAGGGSVDKSANVTAIVDLNGSTDYVEAYGFTTGTTIFGNSAYTNFSGVLVSGAGGGSSQWTTTGNDIFYNTGGVTIGGTTVADNTSVLDLRSTFKGFLPPRMTTAQRDAIPSPAEGLVVYNNTTKSLDLRVASSWLSFGGSMTGNAMVSGWPDAIKCNLTNPNWGTVPLYLTHGPDAGGNYYYRVNIETGTPYSIAFNASGAFTAYQNLVTTDCNTSISSLYTAGKAFNFVGGATASAGGSAGQVQFNEGGNLKADAALHWDNTNKRLGIGTATPGEKLQVAGAVKSTGTGGTLLASSTTIDNLSGTTARLISVGPNAATAGGFHFNAASADNSINFNPVVILPSGNVGIGAAGPSTLLHLASTVPLLTLTDTDTNADSQISASSGAGSLFVQADINNEAASSVLGFYIDGSEKMRVTDAGNVGIGAATPTERLDLGGGNIAMGWERIENNCGNVGANTMCTATCSAGKYATGGACNMGGGAWTNWYQIPGTNSYTCVNNAATKMATSVYCANIR